MKIDDRMIDKISRLAYLEFKEEEKEKIRQDLEQILTFVKKGGKIDALKMKIKKLEEKEKNTAILNMIKILRILKKDDVQIRARLKQEGFAEPEIDSALSEEGEEEEKEEGDVEGDLFGSKG